MLPALPWQALPSPSVDIKMFKACFNISRNMSLGVLTVRDGTVLSDNRVSVTGNLT